MSSIIIIFYFVGRLSVQHLETSEGLVKISTHFSFEPLSCINSAEQLPSPHTVTFTTAALMRSASHRLLPRSLLPFVAPKPLTVPLC
jgi:hypothetical protein